MALAVNGRKKVKTLKDEFKKEFGVSIRVYKGPKFADENATLASIRKGDVAKSGDFDVHANTKVGNVEKQFLENLGIKVQIEAADGSLADNNLTLAQLKK